jgi:predicted dehydrogenase
MMTQPIRFGLIGAGGIAQSHAQAFRSSSLAKVVCVVDNRVDAAAALAEGLGCRSCTEYDALPTQADVDAVLICTPPSTHAEIAIHFLQRGVPVLCEKPVATKLDDALAMVEAARAGNVLFTMASKFRYVDDVIRTKSLLASGVLGEIILFENAFTSRVDMSQRWNSDPAISGGGVLIDNGTHSVDILRYFLGPIVEVQVVEGKRVQGLPVEDTVRVFARTENDVLGAIDLSWSINKELDSYINIYGSNGTARVGWQRSEYRQASSKDWVQFGNGYQKVDALRGQIDNFCRALRNEEPLRITADDAIASVAVVEAAYQSLANSHWIPIAELATP